MHKELKELEISHYESLEEALMCAIEGSKKEVKQIAFLLWPSDRPQTSYQRLIDALNPSKRQKLSIDEIIYIMNLCNRYDPLKYIADRCSHERPKRKTIEVEQTEVKEKLEEMYVKATQAFQQFIQFTKQRDEVEKIRSGVVSFSDLERKVTRG